jgi:ferritin-like metal-binding protein YciE
MDIVDRLEQRIEEILAKQTSLEEENARLRAQLEDVMRQKDGIVERIDALLQRVQETMD